MNIQEGPFQNFTAVHFSSDPLRIALYQYTGFSDPIIRARIDLNEQWGAGRDFSSFDFERFMIGQESGAYIDWSNIPIDDPGINTNAPIGLGVNPYWTGPYHNPVTGALYGFNDRPFIGVLRRDNRTGFYGWPREWHYCPAYDRKYTECVWTEAGAAGSTATARITFEFSGTGLPDETYDQAHENGVTTLASTISALASKVNASSYLSATHVSGGTMRVENTDPERPFYVEEVAWVGSYGGSASRLPFDGVITTPAPAYDFEFNGLQSLGFFDTLDFEQAEAISFASALPEE